jgi:heme/copper-type cytochrome/quinol oxidase subunit 3
MDVVPFRHRPRRTDTTSYVGMVIFLGTWAMMFAGLFFAYADVRWKAPIWPPPGEPRAPLGLPALNTFLIALSSLTLARGLSAVRGAQTFALKRWIGLTMLLGATFLALQSVVWVQLWQSGLRPSNGIYGSVFYALTCFHALHVVVGLLGLALLLPGAIAGRYTVQRHARVRLWAMFWHFVDAIWLVMFVTVYVL